MDRAGSYTVQLIVNDGKVDSLPDQVVINQNSPPTANGGPDKSVAVTTTVTLDGSGSIDVDGDPLTYQWSLHGCRREAPPMLQNPTLV